MKYLLAIIGLFMVGCAGTPHQPQQETKECLNYQSMMIAPISPDAMKRLEEKCIHSRIAN